MVDIVDDIEIEEDFSTSTTSSSTPASSTRFVYTLLHFDQKSDDSSVGFLTLPCCMYDTMIFFKRRWLIVGYMTYFETIG